MSFPGQKAFDGLISRIHRYICHDPQRLKYVNQRAPANQAARSVLTDFSGPETIKGTFELGSRRDWTEKVF